MVITITIDMVIDIIVDVIVDTAIDIVIYLIIIITVDSLFPDLLQLADIFVSLLKVDDLNDLGQIDVKSDRFHYKLKNRNNQSHDPSQLS